MFVLRPVLFPPRWMRVLALAALVVLVANLLWHGSQPYAVGLVPAPWDKLAHLALYGALGAAAWVGLGAGRATADLLAPMAAIAIGVVDEFAQTFSPGRTVSLDDLAADALGAILAVAVLAALRERVRRPPVPATT
ncbi:MAG: hypothetical protein RJA99_4867 [Pseudomonadota bacterium]|jgi:VanZ family protein